MRRLRSYLLLTVTLAVGVGAAPATAAAGPDVRLDVPRQCEPGACRVAVGYRAPARVSAVVEIDWDHTGPAAESFAADEQLTCEDGSRCTRTSPVYRSTGRKTVALRVTVDGTSTYVSRRFSVKARTQSDGSECGPGLRNVNCGPGNGRRTSGGAEKVSHAGWPAVTGILWQVLDTRAHQHRVGTEFNDELLGHHGSDTLNGGPGKDILWGDWDPKGNTTRQVDVMRGGAGDDFIYASHGTNRIDGGPGKDFVYAFFGHGTINCGSGKHDTARVRTNGAYKVRGCERVLNFCGHGQKPGGGCYKPGEKPKSRSHR